jgi:hypothetical protein
MNTFNSTVKNKEVQCERLSSQVFYSSLYLKQKENFCFVYI